MAAIRLRGAGLGLTPVRFAPAGLPDEAGRRYREALALGRHGTMDWLARQPERRASPTALWPEARTAIVCGLNYGPDADPLPELALARPRLPLGLCPPPRLPRRAEGPPEGARRAGSRPGSAREVKVFVDTAPILEKPLAQQAGLGWQGKHTNLVSRELRLVAVPGRDPDRPRAGARPARAGPLRQLPRAASTPARRAPSRHPTGSMPAAASATSPSSTRARSRASCGRPWATGSTAATTASRSAPGTSSRAPRPS